jgi:hypothetical protein
MRLRSNSGSGAIRFSIQKPDMNLLKWTSSEMRLGTLTELCVFMGNPWGSPASCGSPVLGHSRPCLRGSGCLRRDRLRPFHQCRLCEGWGNAESSVSPWKFLRSGASQILLKSIYFYQRSWERRHRVAGHRGCRLVARAMSGPRSPVPSPSRRERVSSHREGARGKGESFFRS